jgi:uroporphyrinogen decarboxylase
MGMTPRERLIAALRRQKPQGRVPHVELEFQLSEEMFGVHALRGEDLKDVSGPRREDMLKRNAEHWIEVARRFDYSYINGTHWLPRDDQIKTFQYIREMAGDAYMFSVYADGTFGIPNGTNMMEHAAWLIEHEEEALQQAQENVEKSVAGCLEMIQAGAEIVLMCADYCFNDGPFLSPRMFRKFVTPFLKQQIAAWKKAGAFPVKHTDGDIMPILDQLAECEPSAIHSLDPMAGIDIKRVKEMVGDRVCLMGNVNCALVQAGTEEQIRQSARYCLEHGGAKQGGYVYATSNCIFKGVPPQNYLVMLDERDRWPDM